MRPLSSAIRAGLFAAVVSGAPSTLHALATGRDPFAATEAAGSLFLPNERRRTVLLAAAVPVHLGISVGWAIVLAAVLPRRQTLVAGAAAGLAIAALDLGVIGPRFPRIRELPLGPQLADHLAFGVAVAAALRQ
jgi:hypothetical protein